MFNIFKKKQKAELPIILDITEELWSEIKERVNQRANFCINPNNYKQIDEGLVNRVEIVKEFGLNNARDIEELSMAKTNLESKQRLMKRILDATSYFSLKYPNLIIAESYLMTEIVNKFKLSFKDSLTYDGFVSNEMIRQMQNLQIDKEDEAYVYMEFEGGLSKIELCCDSIHIRRKKVRQKHESYDEYLKMGFIGYRYIEKPHQEYPTSEANIKKSVLVLTNSEKEKMLNPIIAKPVNFEDTQYFLLSPNIYTS